MKRARTILYFAAATAGTVGAIGTAIFVASLPFTFWSEWRAPLIKIRGVITSNDGVFIAAQGRVYKFDFSGKILHLYVQHGGPLWIKRDGGAVVVRYNSREWPLREPGFRV